MDIMYDKDGFNEKGIHRDTGDKYNLKGFDKYGYDRDGYNEYGYDWHGYNRDGYDRDGYDWQGYNRRRI